MRQLPVNFLLATVAGAIVLIAPGWGCNGESYLVVEPGNQVMVFNVAGMT